MYPEGPGMNDILVDTAARPRDIHLDRTLGACQQERNINGRAGGRAGSICL